MGQSKHISKDVEYIQFDKFKGYYLMAKKPCFKCGGKGLIVKHKLHLRLFSTCSCIIKTPLDVKFINIPRERVMR